MTARLRSFLQGGFECACQRLPDGRRLDLIDGTGHASWARRDYAALRHHGLLTARDGVRWHRVAREPGRYDWSSLLGQARAASAHRVQVIWDLCHYGWPDWLDVWSPAFVDAFARYAAAAAAVLRDESSEAPLYCPINEISYWAWAGGDMAHFGPTATGRGGELKRQLVRATLAAIDAIRAVDPRARFVLADPAIRVHADHPDTWPIARQADAAQYEAWDMLAGRAAAELGGSLAHLDILGVNYYPHNQWVHGGPGVDRADPRYVPLRDILRAMYGRYGKPILLSETGAEGEARVPWLRYVCEEVEQARHDGVPMVGICLYPVTDYPGWGDDRPCPTGLFGFAGVDGRRPVHAPLADEIAYWQHRFAASACPPALPPTPAGRLASAFGGGG